MPVPELSEIDTGRPRPSPGRLLRRPWLLLMALATGSFLLGAFLIPPKQTQDDLNGARLTVDGWTPSLPAIASIVSGRKPSGPRSRKESCSSATAPMTRRIVRPR